MIYDTLFDTNGVHESMFIVTNGMLFNITDIRISISIPKPHLRRFRLAANVFVSSGNPHALSKKDNFVVTSC